MGYRNDLVSRGIYSKKRGHSSGPMLSREVYEMPVNLIHEVDEVFR